MKITRESILADHSMSAETKTKELEYFDYVTEHINNVKTAWSEMKNKSQCIAIIKEYIEDSSFIGMTATIQAINTNIDNHDKSKFGFEEWEPYRKNFYPVTPEEKTQAKQSFDLAWFHHWNWNLHHWVWWDANNCKDAMPVIYVVEMACDWIAMSMKFGGDAYHWYMSQKDIKLGKRQTELIDKLLIAYYDIK